MYKLLNFQYNTVEKEKSLKYAGVEKHLCRCHYCDLKKGGFGVNWVCW